MEVEVGSWPPQAARELREESSSPERPSVAPQIGREDRGESSQEEILRGKGRIRAGGKRDPETHPRGIPLVPAPGVPARCGLSPGEGGRGSCRGAVQVAGIKS